MNNILVGIPVVTGVKHCEEAINSVWGYADILVIENGADEEVKDLLDNRWRRSDINLKVIHNEKNVYVNPAWNQILKYFLESDYERLIIMNSDLTMQHPWRYVCDVYWVVNKDSILVPKINPATGVPPYPYILSHEIVKNGTPGVFITLNKKQAESVYPIPDYIKIWFGDQFIFSVLRKLGYETIVPETLIATTAWSQTINKIPEAHDIIEEDKKQWELYGEADISKYVAR